MKRCWRESESVPYKGNAVQISEQSDERVLLPPGEGGAERRMKVASSRIYTLFSTWAPSPGAVAPPSPEGRGTRLEIVFSHLQIVAFHMRHGFATIMPSQFGQFSLRKEGIWALFLFCLLVVCSCSRA